MVRSDWIGRTISACGADFVAVDLQHGEPSHGQVIPGSNVVEGAPTLVRIAANRVDLIQSALDSGADGVIAPQIENADQARALVADARFPPKGVRSWGSHTTGALKFGGDPEAANEAILVVAIIESSAAVANIEEICAVDGLDAIFIGLSDLALSLGEAPGPTLRRGRHTEAVDRVISACTAAGVPWGTTSSPTLDTNELVERGARLIVVASDLSLIVAGATERLGQRS